LCKLLAKTRAPRLVMGKVTMVSVVVAHTAFSAILNTKTYQEIGLPPDDRAAEGHSSRPTEPTVKVKISP
jgi:hypothetical protein